MPDVQRERDAARVEAADLRRRLRELQRRQREVLHCRQPPCEQCVEMLRRPLPTRRPKGKR